VNVLDKQLFDKVEKMATLIEKQVQNGKLKVIVLYSLKKNSFIVGADVNMIYSIDNQQEAESISREAQLFLNRFEKMTIPTVAAIHGPCMGGGFEVALTCSHRVASSNRITQIGLPEVKLGLIPGAGGTVRLARMLGLKQALELVLAGTTLSSQRAKTLCLVDEVIDYDDEKKFFANIRKYAIKVPDTPPTTKYTRRKRGLSETLLSVSDTYHRYFKNN
jgi:3-hydroxyacyl-CoA dehydrogenase/enoyl-CoA hydratase/3-hydroxybutyryl-CoA epimerase